MSNDITYAKVENGEVVKWPVRSTDVAEWRQNDPKLKNISLPKGVPGPNIMKLFGCFPVLSTDIPDHDPTQYTVMEVWPKQDKNGKVRQVWAIVPLPEETIREHYKLIKEALVGKIVVTVSTGKSFDGDEISQQRMATAILAMKISGEVEKRWILSDNSEVFVTIDELSEALALASKEHTKIWTNKPN